MAHFSQSTKKKKSGGEKAGYQNVSHCPLFVNRQSICQERYFLVTIYFFNYFYQ